MAKSIRQNYIYNVLLNISKVIFPLITAPYVSRVLEPDGVGLFNFANTYAGYFALFAALGIPYYGIREVAKYKDDVESQTKFISEIISISIIATLVSSTLMFLSLVLVPQLNDNYLLFIVAGIVLYTTPFKIDWFFQGKEEFGYITFRSLVIKILSVILLFVIVRDKSDLLLYVALNACCSALNEVWNYIKLIRCGIHPYFTLSGRKHIKPLFVLFSSTVAISVYTILDTLMLGFMTNYDQVGYYYCATHISKAVLPLVTSLAAVVLPRVTQLKEIGNWEEINILMNKSFSIVSFLSFPIAFGIIALAPAFVPLFFGEMYYGSIIPLQIIILTVIVIGFNNLTGIQILLGFGYDKYFLYSILSGTIINFVLNIMMIPMLGAAGAAISSVIAEILILAIMLCFIYKNTTIRFQNLKETLQNIIIASFFFVIAYFIFNYHKDWEGVGIVVAVCMALYLSSQYFLRNKTEKEIVSIIRNKVFNSHNS